MHVRFRGTLGRGDGSGRAFREGSGGHGAPTVSTGGSYSGLAELLRFS